MKKSKRYIKKQNNKPLINIEAVVFENGGFVGNLGLSKKTMEKIY